ncbi:MAG: hypothetical protein U0903_17555 [Planctomycetales bacterium]
MADWKIWDLQALTYSDDRAEFKYLRTNPELGRVEIDVGSGTAVAVEDHAGTAHFPHPITLLSLSSLPLGTPVVARLIDSFGSEKARTTAIVTSGWWRPPVPVAPPPPSAGTTSPSPDQAPADQTAPQTGQAQGHLFRHEEETCGASSKKEACQTRRHEAGEGEEKTGQGGPCEEESVS